ncbi:50S ribosomal subunit protein L17 [Candidatus Hodgkinia cicadicola]|uniref:50S ribosomal protein L17 n=1 Tax=Candidatus Hodgkinia cicadicola TaxID=573658 RepID=A0ABX4MGN4_9HYPH|nr:50S ribosomal subunit protein L17 [Candidatus Hodgkinia cicadicola]PIM95969.1 50S ribosomal subunit protein L17 [Candidatus Hodgkinia cicadicola]PIM96188.1 50S ribosomal subunit protein L17 [Candidatus Hodgkinia cicadicola]
MVRLSKHEVINLIRCFIMTGRLVSTSERLKAVKTDIERILNRIKNIKIDKPQETIRLLRSKLKCGQRFAVLIGYLFSKIKSTNGGYTKLIRLWRRDGDGAVTSILIPSNH